MREYTITNDLNLDAIKDLVSCPPDNWGEPYECVTEYRDGLDDWNCGESICEIKESVVRCRNCKDFREKGFVYDEEDRRNDAPHDSCLRLSNYDYEWDWMSWYEVKPDNFCCWGERKDD